MLVAIELTDEEANVLSAAGRVLDTPVPVGRRQDGVQVSPRAAVREQAQLIGAVLFVRVYDALPVDV